MRQRSQHPSASSVTLSTVGRNRNASGAAATATLRAALYLRRSTEEHQAASLEVQEVEARRFVAKHGWTLANDHVYSDSGISRAEFLKRAGLMALHRAVEAREIDVVVTRDETRLGGDMIRVTLFLQDIQDAGARVFYYYTGEEVVLNDAIAKFMVTARNFAAELEREKIAQRTHEHLLVKARQGRNVGGRLYGYDNVPVMDGETRKHVNYAINSEQAAVIGEIFERYGRGEGLRTIVKELNRRGVPSPRAGKRGTGSWSISAIYSMLRNTKYIGVIEWNQREKTYRKGTKVRILRQPHEFVRVEAPDMRILSDDVWNAAQAQMRKNAERTAATTPAKKNGRPAKYLLAGLARCGCCGGPLTAVPGRDGTTTIKVYMCARRRDRGDTVCANKTRRPVDGVNDAVMNWIQTEYLTERHVLDALRKVRERLLARAKLTTANDLPQVEARATKLRTEITNLVDVIAVTPKAAAASLIAGLGERQKELNELEARLRATKTAPEAITFELARMEADAKKLVANLRKTVNLAPDRARAFLEAVFDGKLTATPVETEAGPRFQVEGRASLVPMLTADFAQVSENPCGILRPRRDSNPC